MVVCIEKWRKYVAVDHYKRGESAEMPSALSESAFALPRSTTWGSVSSVLIAFYSSLTWLQHMHGYEELIHVEFDGILSKNWSEALF